MTGFFVSHNFSIPFVECVRKVHTIPSPVSAKNVVHIVALKYDKNPVYRVVTNISGVHLGVGAYSQKPNDAKNFHNFAEAWFQPFSGNLESLLGPIYESCKG